MINNLEILKSNFPRKYSIDLEYLFELLNYEDRLFYPNFSNVSVDSEIIKVPSRVYCEEIPNCMIRQRKDNCG
jgi:hypothetical protein